MRLFFCLEGALALDGKLKPAAGYRSQRTQTIRPKLDMTTLTIMKLLPREVDPTVFNMVNEDPGKVVQESIGGLSEQIRKLKETIELPLTNPDLFLLNTKE